MMKQNMSLLLKKFFFQSGIYDLIRRTSPNPKVAILRYHAIVEEKDNLYTSPAIALSPEQFEKHVKYFAKKYTVLSLDDIVDCLLAKRPLPPNSIAFTFDDGYADNFLAAEILQKYGANGTFFVTTAPIGRESKFWLSEVTYLILKTPKNYLIIENGEQQIHFSLTDKNTRWKAIREIVKLIKCNNRIVREDVRKQLFEQLGDEFLLHQVENLILTWDQVRQMLSMGMIFGSHTMTHLNLVNADPEDARLEIFTSKKVLEDKLGCKIRHFSYPNSGPYEYFNERIRRYVIEAEYDCSCTSNNGFVDHSSDYFALERVRTVPDLEEVIHGMEWDRLFSR